MIIPIPFVFYKYGHKIREKSALIKEMRENEERQERKRKRAEQKMKKPPQQQLGIPKIEVEAVNGTEKDVEKAAEADANYTS
ncbi:mfs dha1 multidrug resistance protein [Lasallia pustulata]|uniref:Mfs dha1 multidrug resistance protein n=1 Tax=Lasallia pustulata TaxID=136370 RepID=A0A1W5D193_9LECA|nr:mfs dha1 multidrug resistance protein [Lasallia pustulata]